MQYESKKKKLIAGKGVMLLVLVVRGGALKIPGTEVGLYDAKGCRLILRHPAKYQNRTRHTHRQNQKNTPKAERLRGQNITLQS